MGLKLLGGHADLRPAIEFFIKEAVGITLRKAGRTIMREPGRNLPGLDQRQDIGVGRPVPFLIKKHVRRMGQVFPELLIKPHDACIIMQAERIEDDVVMAFVP
ncbi:hypothetical protein [Gluconacetobacter entanii]|uniref:hypothetical protein n=1 Tax=Gluconacetobacter entanii TaxID=108528 RepID=UPI00142E2523|nr:hypothetical protein [Gluconacetobacter entanii]